MSPWGHSSIPNADVTCSPSMSQLKFLGAAFLGPSDECLCYLSLMTPILSPSTIHSPCPYLFNVSPLLVYIMTLILHAKESSGHVADAQ